MRTGERGLRLPTLVAAPVFVVGLGTAGAAPAPAARALPAAPSAPAVAAPDAAGTCASARGPATPTLTVAGRPIPVPARPNTALGLPHGLRPTLDEHSPPPNADTGLTVTAAHLVLPAPAPAADPVGITIASAASAAHNCH